MLGITWESTDEYESKHMHTNIMKVLHGDTGNSDYDAGEDGAGGDEIDDNGGQNRINCKVSSPHKCFNFSKSTVFKRFATKSTVF